MLKTKRLTRAWGAQRLVNLINAWRDQMLEALGAMGMREIRRLRGEIGRTIWHKTENALFKEGLGGSKALSALPRLKIQAGAEGDFRWPQTLFAGISTTGAYRSAAHRVGVGLSLRCIGWRI